MSLFIGNISSSVSVSDLEKAFGEYGRCSINYKGSYAFAEFDHEKEAEGAFDTLQNKNMGGRQINIEWSKKSKRFDESKCKRRRRSSSRKREGRCFNCGKRGHFLRDCKQSRRRDHGRSRSKSRSRSRSRRRSHSRGRRSTSKDRRQRKSKRRSHSSKKSRSHSHRKRSASSRKSKSDKSPNRYDKRNQSSSQEKENNNNKTTTSASATVTVKELEKNTNNNNNNNPENNNNNKIEKSDMYTSKLVQILGNEFSEQKQPEAGENNINNDKRTITIIDEKNGSGNNTNIKGEESNDANEKNGDAIIEDVKNWDMSKLRNECKKRNISMPKNPKKSELVDLLLKKGD